MHTYKSDQCDPIYKCMHMMMLYDGHYNEIGYFLLKDFIQMLEQNNSTISLRLCRWSTNSLVKSFTKSNCNYLFQM